MEYVKKLFDTSRTASIPIPPQQDARVLPSVSHGMAWLFPTVPTAPAESGADSVANADGYDVPQQAEPASRLGVSLIALTPNGCRYPLWEDSSGPYLYCGEDKSGDGSYCQAHHSICLRKARNTDAFQQSKQHSNITKTRLTSAPKPRKPAKAKLGPSRHPPQSTTSPFSAGSLRDIVFTAIHNHPMSVDDICDKTGLTLARVRETVADLAYKASAKGRYQVVRDKAAGTVAIVAPLDVSAMIG